MSPAGSRGKVAVKVELPEHGATPTGGGATMTGAPPTGGGVETAEDTAMMEVVVPVPGV